MEPHVLAVVIASCHLLGFASSIHALMTARTPQGSIAWLVALNTFPYLAVPAYWVFGRSRFQGYVTEWRRKDSQSAALLATLEERMARFRVPLPFVDGESSVAERLAGLPFTGCNGVTLLVDGDATFDSILAGVDAAREYVLFQFFIVKDDEIGRRVQRHLVDRARAGVRVYFLYDEVGSHALPRSYLDALRAAGVRVAPFNTRRGPRNRFQVNFRNHRKLVVTDGRAAWVGGHNVGDEYMGKDPKFGHWRDTHVRVEGPAVLGAQLSFLEDWQWATSESLELRWEPAPATDGATASVLVVPSSPADTLETATLMFLQALGSARRRIWIASPYFVPDRALVSALQLAGLRGVEVRILIPSIADHLLSFLNAYAYLADGGATGVRFFRYRDGFTHQKVVLIDDQVATVGSANFDNRSFRLNFELTAIVHDPAFVAAVEGMLQADFAKASEEPHDALARKPWWFRLAVRCATLTAPIQ
jgi:cardiolipin synthase